MYWVMDGCDRWSAGVRLWKANPVAGSAVRPRNHCQTAARHRRNAHTRACTSTVVCCDKRMVHRHRPIGIGERRSSAGNPWPECASPRARHRCGPVLHACVQRTARSVGASFALRTRGAMSTRAVNNAGPTVAARAAVDPATGDTSAGSGGSPARLRFRRSVCAGAGRVDSREQASTAGSHVVAALHSAAAGKRVAIPRNHTSALVCADRLLLRLLQQRQRIALDAMSGIGESDGLGHLDLQVSTIARRESQRSGVGLRLLR